VKDMKNLIYPLIAAVVIIAMGFQSKQALFEDSEAAIHEPAETLGELKREPSPFELQRAFDESVSPWLVQPPKIHLIAQQGELTQSFDLESQNAAKIRSLEHKLLELSQVKASSFGMEQRIDTLESQMREVKSDVVDLSAGQADLVKRIEELAALIEVRCPDGKVKTAAVQLNATGMGTYALAPGEILLSVDGVPVNAASSGGSTGSFTASTTTANYGSYPTSAPKSGGSNGSLNYTAQQTSFQTSTYDVRTTPTPTATNVQVQRRPLQQIRSNGGLFNRNAPQTCIGPNCPN
jgi:hypothetical protein